MRGAVTTLMPDFMINSSTPLLIDVAVSRSTMVSRTRASTILDRSQSEMVSSEVRTKRLRSVVSIKFPLFFVSPRNY